MVKVADITVDFIDRMGNDLTVVNAARVSFAKESGYVCSSDNARTPMWEYTQGDAAVRYLDLSDKDKRLINYLAKNNHWTPFSHCMATFRVKAPIFVSRQLVRHTVGLTINEESRRYIDEPPEFYFPVEWRKRAENIKQGSSNETFTGREKDLISDMVYQDTATAYQLYDSLLSRGVAPEMARMVLPLNTMTSWYWTGSLAAFARMCNLRLDAHAQAETSIVAQQVSKYMANTFPVSWANLVAASIECNNVAG